MTGQGMLDDVFDWNHDKLSGRVHTVDTDIRHFITEDRKRLKTPKLLSSENIEYEASGKRSSRIFILKGARSVYRYDSAGHQVESVTCEADGQFRDREVSSFDGNRLKSTVLELRDGEKVIQDFSYSSEGFSVKLTAAGRLVMETYDNRGNRLLSESYYGNDGSPAQKDILHYDSQHRLIEIVTNYSGALDHFIVTSQAGGRTTTTRGPNAERIDRTTFTYDPDARRVRISRPAMTLDLNDESHRAIYETFFKIKPQAGALAQGSKREITSRDSHGNWLEETISMEEDGRLLPLQVATRRIVYFPG